MQGVSVWMGCASSKVCGPGQVVVDVETVATADRVFYLSTFLSYQVYFNQDPKLASELLYCQANVMLGYHATLQKQRLFKDKTATTIDHFLTTRHYALTFCK